MASLLPEIPEKLLLEIYGDIAKPGVQQVGKAIGGILGILNLATIPFKLLSERGNIWLEKNLETYREKLSEIHYDEIIEVQPSIAAPIIEKMAYNTNEELGEMFANLLKNASTKSGVASVHPSFVNIVSSISSDEAIILKDFENGRSIPSLKIKQTFSSGNFVTPILIYTKYYTNEDLIFPENDEFYFNNLTNLGLTYESIAELSNSYYEELIEKINPRLERIRTEDTSKFSKFKHHVGTTSIGRMFLKAVNN